MTNLIEIVADDWNDVTAKLESLIESIAATSISSNGIFNVGLSGGSLVQMLEECLPRLKTDWDKWRFFFCDERVVPFDDADSTYGLYRKSLIGTIPIKEEQFFTIQPGLSAVDAAAEYEKKLKENFGKNIPEFDLLLLGVGPDGHTCSLFPGHSVLEENKLWVAPITDSPKPPPSRITLTYAVINNAQNCVFALSGKGKAGILKKILEDKADLPAAKVSPNSGKLYWIFDKDAASEMKRS